MAGNKLEEAFYGLDGRLMNLSNGHARMRMSFDEKNRPVETLCFDQNNRPVDIRSAECTRIVFEYAAAGYKCRARHYSVSGERTDMIYDERGRHVGTEFYFANGDRRVDRNGVVSVKFKRDAAGREIKRGYFGIDGHRCLSEDLIAGWNTIYDADGNRIEESFIGLDGGIVNGRDGVAINRWTFDADGHETSRTFYDVHTNIVANPRGHAGTRWRYDAKGRKIEEFQIGTDGRPAVDENGVHVVRFAYDDALRLQSRTFYDGNGNCVANKGGVAGWVSELDANGREIKRTWKDVSGNCVTNKDGVAGWVSELDEDGREVKRMWKDARGGRLLHGGGYGWMRKYDESNRVVEECQLEADGATPRPTEQIVNGYPLMLGKVAFEYDKIGRKTAISQAAAPGGALGGDKIVVAYTLDGDEAELRTVDAEGRLVNNHLGWARREVRYNEYREPTTESYWDKDGNPATQLATGVSRGEIFYRRNPSGLTVELHTYSTNGYHVVDRQNGYAMLIAKYDRLHRLRSFEVFDESGKPTGGQGTRLAKEFVTYAGNGRISEIRFVTTDNKGIFDESVFGYRFEFDNQQMGKARIVSLDAKGMPLESTEVPLDECDQFQSRFMVRYSAKLANRNL